jgi:transposase
MERKDIVLSAEERVELKRFSTKGMRSVRLVNRAKIILAFDTSEGRKAETQESIAKRIGVSRQTVNNAKRDFLATQSVAMFLQREKRATPPVEPKITGDVEARIIALACSEVPAGYAKWTLQLIADKCVELQYISSISPSSVGCVLKKTNFSLI